MLAENLIAMMLGLEVASGNDALASHSEMRKSAKLMLQFIPGTDFITSGYGSIPRYDNMFGGGNFDTTELDDWYVIQRDMRVDGGIHPIRDETVLQVRRRGALAIQAIFDAFDFAQISDAEVEAAATAYSSEDMPDRDRIADIRAAQMLLDGPLTIVEVIQTLAQAGYADLAENVLEMQRQRAIGDYLQTSAIFAADAPGSYRVLSALTDPNDYAGPGTGYRVEGQRWDQLQDLPQAWDPQQFIHDLDCDVCDPWLKEVGPALPGATTEVVIAVGPAFGTGIQHALSGLDLRQVLDALVQGVRDEGLPSRIRARLCDIGLCLHRPRRRSTQRIRCRHRHPIKGYGGHPPARPCATRKPRALLDGAQP